MRFDPSQRYIVNSQAEFLNLLDEAIFEVDDYIVCVQEDLEDELDDLTTSLEQILDYLKQLKSDVTDGRHSFKNGVPLEYMPLIRKLRHVLPFYALLDGLNSSHLKGIDS